jgi:hypothetical protein
MAECEIIDAQWYCFLIGLFLIFRAAEITVQSDYFGAFMLPGYLLRLSYLQIPLCDNLFDLNHSVCVDDCVI